MGEGLLQQQDEVDRRHPIMGQWLRIAAPLKMDGERASTA